MTAFNAFWASIGTRKHTDTALVDILREIPIFEGLGKLELQLVSRILHHRNYHQGELVFRESEAGNGMYIIKNGKVDILGNLESEDETVYATLHDRQFFGELALIDGAPRSASAVASAESTLLGFFKPDLLELIDKNPMIGSKILLNLSSVLAERLRIMNGQVLGLQSRLAQLSPQEAEDV